MKCIPPSGFLLREDGVALARLTEEAGGRPGVSAVPRRSIGACSTVRDSRFLRAWRVRIVQWPGGYGPRALVVVSGRLSPESALRQRSWGLDLLARAEAVQSGQARKRAENGAEPRASWTGDRCHVGAQDVGPKK